MKLMTDATEHQPRLRVKDWDTHFENAQSRKVRRLTWVAVPTSHDGAGFRRLAAMKEATEVYAAWILILQIASRLPERGVLVDSDNRALTAEYFAVRTGYPETIFKLALEVLTKPGIGWLVPADDPKVGCYPATVVARPATVGGSPTTPDDGGATGKGREGQTLPDPTRPDPTGQTLPDPTRQASGAPCSKSPPADKVTDRTGPDSARETGTGPDRGKLSDERFRNLFVLRICEVLGFSSEQAMAQRKSLLATVRRFIDRRDRDRIAQELIALAKEKKAAGLDRPIAAWQKDVGRRFPKCKR